MSLRGTLFCGVLGIAGAVAASGCSGGETIAPGASSTSGSGGAGGASSSSTTTATSVTTVVTATSGSGGTRPLPESFTVTGVVTDGAAPLEGAIVMQGGGSPDLVTGPGGTFSLAMSSAMPGKPTIVATKLGYRTNGVEISELPDGPVEIALRFVSPPDNIGYVYGDPGKGDIASDGSTAYCGHCHTTLVAQFQTSAHARSARDPLVQAEYAGVSEAYADAASCASAGGVFRAGLVPGTAGSSAPKCYLGGGVLPDLNPSCGAPAGLACDDPALPAAQKPSAFGLCADCHAPAVDGPAGGRDLHEATGIAFENGNHCDLCHHVRDVDLAAPPGVGGRLVLQRPSDKVSADPGAKLVPVMYGPLPDVPNAFMGGSYQPKFATSELCAGCHEQRQPALVPGEALDAARWPLGLPTHSTYEEWAESPYNPTGTPCQACHMPPDDTGLVNTVDVTKPAQTGITFGFARPASQIRKHTFRGPLEGSPRLIDGVVAMGLVPVVSGGSLNVKVTLQNVGAGHAVPSGEPMRALVLLVAGTACGAALVPSGGMTVNDAGGAIAASTVGAGVTVAGQTITWAAASRAKEGDVVRVVRPTGTYDDYAGVGLFAGASLSAAEKGLEVRAPVGEAKVVSVGPGSLVLDAALPAQAGDIVYLGDAAADPPVEGAASTALAGMPGYTFARVLVGADGARLVPHHRAVDIASDNRLLPFVDARTTHAFAIPAGCQAASVRATLVYRPVPVELGRLRGLPAIDHVIASASANVSLP